VHRKVLMLIPVLDCCGRYCLLLLLTRPSPPAFS